MVAKLSDDKDIGAALVGTSDASSLREILASLDAKQQALLLGHAVPMPIVVKTRTYDQDFYEALRTHPAVQGPVDEASDPDEEMEDLFY
jgi:DNA helicase HerA-like ATPase